FVLLLVPVFRFFLDSVGAVGPGVPAPAAACHHQHELAAGRLRLNPPEQGRERAAPRLLELLRQLPRDRSGPIPENLQEIPDRPREPVRGLEEDDGPGLAAQLLDARAPPAAPPREEPFERESVGRKTRDLQRA